MKQLEVLRFRGFVEPVLTEVAVDGLFNVGFFERQGLQLHDSPEFVDFVFGQVRKMSHARSALVEFVDLPL